MRSRYVKSTQLWTAAKDAPNNGSYGWIQFSFTLRLVEEWTMSRFGNRFMRLEQRTDPG